MFCALHNNPFANIKMIGDIDPLALTGQSLGPMTAHQHVHPSHSYQSLQIRSGNIRAFNPDCLPNLISQSASVID